MARATKKKKVARNDGAPLFDATWSFDETRVVTSNRLSTSIFDVHEGSQIHSFRDAGFTPQAVAIARDGTRIAACGIDLSQPRSTHALRVWDVPSGARTVCGYVGGNNTNACFRFAPDGHAVAIASFSLFADHEHSSIFIWRDADRPAVELVRPGREPDSIAAVDWLRDGRVLLATSAELRAFDPVTSTTVVIGALPQPHEDKVFSHVEDDSIAFGTRAAGLIGRIRLSTGTCEQHAAPGVNELVLSADGNTVFAASEQPPERWHLTCELATGNIDQVTFPEAVRPSQQWLSPRGMRVLYANEAGALRLWNVSSGEVVALWRKL